MCAPSWLLGGDHPRSRGVYDSKKKLDDFEAGSSPLARGLLWEPGREPDTPRIIPARAGFTASRCNASRTQPDHPRSRGVYEFCRGESSPDPGSSPLARGLRSGVVLGGEVDGIIPARAGFTCANCPSTLNSSDHPRSRGVYTRMLAQAQFPQGSSPLARGLPWGSGYPHTDHGIIPARAGFTDTRGAQSGVRQDHPRSRGVYQNSRLMRSLSVGSSPLARGLLGLNGQAVGAGRIIPARAGFTAGIRGEIRGR